MTTGAADGRAFWPGILLLLLSFGFLVNGLINGRQGADFWANGMWVALAATFAWLLLRRKYAIPRERTAPLRPHPYADEASPEAETRWEPRQVTAVWLFASTILAGLGLWINFQFSPYSLGYRPETAPDLFAPWNNTNVSILGTGLLLLGLKAWGPAKWTWTKWLGLPGWVLFGFYWGLTARDLFIGEDSDYVNSIGAVIAVYLFNYFAYHEWLDIVRKAPSAAIQWARKTVVIAAGTYFAIAYIDPLRVGLIRVVGNHTNWALNVFGLGSRQGLEFVIDKENILGPVKFRYSDTHELCPDGTEPAYTPGSAPCLEQSGADSWLDDLLFYIPEGEMLPGAHGLKIVWVAIILACTAIQTIMLFAGMFLATPGASWKKRIQFSVGVGAAIYFLNLLRNSLVIWAYGRGHTSFWVIHNFLAKILTLSALVGIAWVCFRWFPEFFRILGQVLDLGHRDGPIERTLKLGRRRPEAPLEAPAE